MLLETERKYIVACVGVEWSGIAYDNGKCVSVSVYCWCVCVWLSVYVCVSVRVVAPRPLVNSSSIYVLFVGMYYQVSICIISNTMLTMCWIFTVLLYVILEGLSDL